MGVLWSNFLVLVNMLAAAIENIKHFEALKKIQLLVEGWKCCFLQGKKTGHKSIDETKAWMSVHSNIYSNSFNIKVLIPCRF